MSTMGVPKRLTEMQKRFAEYLVFNEGRTTGADAAIAAGYSEKRARVEASELQNPKLSPLVVQYIGALREENLKKYENYFVASAHQSMFETFALQTVIPGPIFILKKELMRIPFFGWCLKKIGAIDIVRETATKQNLSFFDKHLF